MVYPAAIQDMGHVAKLESHLCFGCHQVRGNSEPSNSEGKENSF